MEWRHDAFDTNFVTAYPNTPYPYSFRQDRAAQSLHAMLASQRVPGNDPVAAIKIFRLVVSFVVGVPVEF